MDRPCWTVSMITIIPSYLMNVWNMPKVVIKKKETIYEHFIQCGIFTIVSWLCLFVHMSTVDVEYHWNRSRVKLTSSSVIVMTRSSDQTTCSYVYCKFTKIPKIKKKIRTILLLFFLYSNRMPNISVFYYVVTQYGFIIDSLTDLIRHFSGII